MACLPEARNIQDFDRVLLRMRTNLRNLHLKQRAGIWDTVILRDAPASDFYILA